MPHQTYNGLRPSSPGSAPAHRLGRHPIGYSTPMLYTILIILAIVALVLFILGRRSV
jgi:hypothetical protein